VASTDCGRLGARGPRRLARVVEIGEEAGGNGDRGQEVEGTQLDSPALACCPIRGAHGTAARLRAPPLVASLTSPRLRITPAHLGHIGVMKVRGPLCTRRSDGWVAMVRDLRF
jgi:hypothetical protein